MAMILYFSAIVPDDCSVFIDGEESPNSQSVFGQTWVAGNTRIGKPKRCEQKRRCRKARVPSGIVLSKDRNATAKSLPGSKTRASQEELSLEPNGNVWSRQIIIHLVLNTRRQNSAYRHKGD